MGVIKTLYFAFFTRVFMFLEICMFVFIIIWDNTKFNIILGLLLAYMDEKGICVLCTFVHRTWESLETSCTFTF